MDAPGDFFPLRCITLPRCFQQEAVRLREGCVGWMGKVKGVFSPVSVLQTSLQQLAYMESDCTCPCLLKGVAFQILGRCLVILNLIKSVSQFCNIDLKVISV